MEIPDGCWDIFHIIEHLEEAEMLRDVQCHPGDYYTTVKRNQMGAILQKSRDNEAP